MCREEKSFSLSEMCESKFKGKDICGVTYR